MQYEIWRGHLPIDLQVTAEIARLSGGAHDSPIRNNMDSLERLLVFCCTVNDARKVLHYLAYKKGTVAHFIGGAVCVCVCVTFLDLFMFQQWRDVRAACL